MLAPMDIEPIQNTIKAFYLDICAADKIAFASKSVNIYPLSNEYQWITGVRSNLNILSDSGDIWQKSKIGIISDIITPFITYANVFKATGNIFANATSGQVAVNILDKFIKEVNDNIISVRTAKLNFEDCIEKTLSNIDPLNDSIKNGWKQLASSEYKLTKLSEKIALTQFKILELDEAASLTSLSSIPVNDFKNICSGCVNIGYSMLVDGLSLSYLSVSLLVYSFGKMIYDISSNAKSFEKENTSLQEYSQDLNKEQKAMCQTKALIQLLYTLKDAVKIQNSALEQIETFWKDEKRNLMNTRDNFSTSKTFETKNSEALQIPVGIVVWETLENTADDLLAWINKPAIRDILNVEIKI